MTSHLGKIFVTELDNELDERITENCSIRILSSSAWNEVSEEDKLLQGSFMLQNISNGGALPFVPMRFWPSRGEIRLGPPQQKTSASVTLEILETTALNQLSTKASITAWLSVDHDADEVRTEVDRLVREGYLAPVRPEAGPQVPL